ncbi:MAG: orotate phosphoribosyltransferase, partial [Methanomassiliicoccaceae archaeon]|nr:orotate phosphoribosyltransferase [Methanomassiliicoccaceae archaeon]
MSEISKALEECGALQFGEFTLASGAKSSYYINIKKASTNPRVLYRISLLMAEKMQMENIRPDKIAGIVLGSIPLAAALSMATGIPYVMVRKEQKDHGTKELIEG